MSRKSRFSAISFLFSAFVFLFSSCIKAPDYVAIEKQDIENYLADNPTLAFVKKESGLYYLEVTPGTGETVRLHDTAYVVYKGQFLDGTVFDPGTDTLAFAVGAGDLVPGFDEGVSYMKAGGKSKLLIPSSLAYGATGYYIIPGYTPLLFDITLARIVRMSK
jgi:FKBP-type peptidyl-prolyl cis-trans isomerase FkpA